MFLPGTDDETKLPGHETIFVPGEDIRKQALDIKAPTNDGPKAHEQGIVMIKMLSAVVLAAFISATFTFLAPQVEASVPVALAKSDRLDIRPVGHDCSRQAWPNFEASCLRAAGAKTKVQEARLVTADRTP